MMRTSSISRLTALSAVLLLAGTVRAESPVTAASYESDIAKYTDRLAALEAEVARLRRNSYSGGCGADVCSDCGCAAFACCCGPTWYAGGEVPFLQVFETSIAIPVLGIQTPEYDQEPSVRAWAGVEGCSGLGFRASYFDFEDDAAAPLVAGITLATAIDIYAVDLELTQRGQFCGWDVLLSGGVRIAGIEQSLNVAAPGPTTINVTRDFDGAGLTFAAGFERPVSCTRLNLYGNFRGSLLYGDTDLDLTVAIPGVVAFALPPAAEFEDQAFMVWEIQLGLEYAVETRFGNLFSRAGVEGQVWEIAPVLLGLGDDNVGLFGPVFGVGLER